jgi:hypothetical protein
VDLILTKLLSEFNKASLRLCVDGFVANRGGFDSHALIEIRSSLAYLDASILVIDGRRPAFEI